MACPYVNFQWVTRAIITRRRILHTFLCHGLHSDARQATGLSLDVRAFVSRTPLRRSRSHRFLMSADD